MQKFSYVWSYFVPVRIEKTSSALNPVLEVDLSNGRYILNSENMNYSFGTLHVLFRKIFRRLKPDWNAINHVLILGFGTGSVASIIRGYKPECRITGVEADRKVLELGEKYFHTGLLPNITIHQGKADVFFDNNPETFDLIVIDAYVDMKVPEELENAGFLEKVKNGLHAGGLVVFNKVVYSKASREQIPVLIETYKTIFENVRIMTVMNTGKIFISKRLS